MQRDPNAAPFNPLPAVVWALALPMIAMEIVLFLGSQGVVGGPQAVGWRLQALQRFAYAPEIFRQMLAIGVYPPEQLARFVTYPFVHGNFTHALFVIVILLALGKMVAEVFRPWAVLVIFFGAAIVGALAYTLLPGQQLALFGGYPAVYGLIGAFTFLLWVRLTAVGSNGYRAFTMIAFLMGVQILFGLIFGSNFEWVADLAGFAAGFLLSFLVVPGGWRRVLEHLRRR